MPLFYFDVRDDGQSFPDDEGQHLASIDAAEAEAAEAAAPLPSMYCRRGEAANW